MDQKKKITNLNKPWLSAREASELLCIQPTTLRNWCSQGRVPYHKIKGCRKGRNVFNRQELEELFSSKLGGYRCDY